MRIAPSFRGAKGNYFPPNERTNAAGHTEGLPIPMFASRESFTCFSIGLFARLLFQHHLVTNTNPLGTHTHARARTHADTTCALVPCWYRISRDFSVQEVFVSSRFFLLPTSCCDVSECPPHTSFTRTIALPAPALLRVLISLLRRRQHKCHTRTAGILRERVFPHIGFTLPVLNTAGGTGHPFGNCHATFVCRNS